MLPVPVLEALPRGARVVEVGVGGRFDVLASIARQRPDVEPVATDVRTSALETAPADVQTHVDDVVEPEITLYEDAALVYAVRCPAELQVPLARLAARIGADLALRAFKDEWADVDAILGPHTLFSTRTGAWRWWPRDRPSDRDRGASEAV